MRDLKVITTMTLEKWHTPSGDLRYGVVGGLLPRKDLPGYFVVFQKENKETDEIYIQLDSTRLALLVNAKLALDSWTRIPQHQVPKGIWRRLEQGKWQLDMRRGPWIGFTSPRHPYSAFSVEMKIDVGRLEQLLRQELKLRVAKPDQMYA